ncbi:acyl-CoA dehydrogenase family protein [Shimazuella sp. AN120528]|uniref:acyl-CoA dehydrogenase family protein n=1 Tax=Shimazuella soli TaxID=1892854 RepID=UPI001F0E2DA6|nr:acyl-CoA dehydrogenase family protein [Shimazuella soli]MCH5586481.1 acyl-CoA dehydrogenase family protein [Shimazuella soli]
MGKGGSFLVTETLPADVFTPEDFTAEQKMMAKMTEEFVKEQVWPVLAEIEEHQFSHTVRLLKEAGELGLLGADVPEEFDGLGLDKISSTLITEKMALSRSFALSHGAHVGIGTLPIVFFGTKAQKQKYLPDLASGKKLAAYALTEPGSGSDALGAKTTAVLNQAGTHYLLNGEKQWITNSAFADLFIVYAKVDGDKFTAFIVERDFPGVSTGVEEKKMGIKGSSTRTLILQDAQIPVENVLGEIGKGHRIAFNILNLGRFKLAAGTLGSAKRAIEISKEYALERKQFGVPIATFALIREKLANMQIQTYALESMVYRIAGLFEQGLSTIEQSDGQEVAKSIHEWAIECSLAKVFGSETLDFVVDEGVQIHGGYGFMQEYEIENMYRDSRINRIFEGTNEINRLLIPGTLLKRALSGELPLMAAVADLTKEIMNYTPSLEQESDNLSVIEKIVQNSKKSFLLTAGTAVDKYREKIDQEQEVLRDLADIVTLLFALESAFLRTKKHPDTSKEEMTLALAFDTKEKIDRAARHALSAIFTGDELTTHLAILRRYNRVKPINEVVLKRLITERLLKT